MQNIAQKLDQSRQSLLDLSARNRLLNIPQRASGKLINIYDEKTSEVYRILVADSKSMSFLAGRKDSADEKSEEDAADDEAGVSLPQPDADDNNNGRQSDLKLQTKLVSEKLQHRLLEMYYDARTFIEEQGVNILYLALGQLKWFDKNTPDKERLAPLVLVPVALNRKSAADRFHLSWLQEEAAENLSLTAKLKADFGLIMPDFQAGDDFDPQAYVREVSQVVSVQPKWEVLPDAICLGFFSFAKFLMYRDLDPVNWPQEQAIDRQPLISAVMQDGFPQKEQIFPDEIHVDQLIPVDTQRHVVDADSSQTLAIEAVRAGEHVVIQGPPGTGKSQTITNVIAAAVADGKTVLFVSEKMAALEVVRRRLNAVGLGPACLELHSNRSNKRHVLDELKATKELGRPKVASRDEIVGGLAQLQQLLNGHAQRMHRRFAPYQLSAYQVIGQLARLERTDLTVHPDLAAPGCASWSPEEFTVRQAAVRELRHKSERIGAAAAHPWRGVSHKAVLKLDADRWLVAARQLGETLAALLPLRAKLAASLLQAPAADPATLLDHVGMAKKFAAAPQLDRAAIAHAAWASGFRALAELVAHGERYAESRARLQPLFLDGAWDEPIEDHRRRIAEHGDSLLRIFVGPYRQALGAIKALMKQPLPRPHRERLELIDALLRSIALRAKLAAGTPLGADAFGSYWQGENSDWAQLKAIVAWISAGSDTPISAHLRELYARLPAPAECSAAAAECQSVLGKLATETAQVLQNYQLDLMEAFGVEALQNVPFEALQQRIDEWMQQPTTLFDWTQYHAARQHAKDLGLQALVLQFEHGKAARDDLSSLVEKTYYEAVLRDLCRQLPELVGFDGGQHLRHVDLFKALDKKRIELAAPRPRFTTSSACQRGQAASGRWVS